MKIDQLRVALEPFAKLGEGYLPVDAFDAGPYGRQPDEVNVVVTVGVGDLRRAARLIRQMEQDVANLHT